MDWGNIAKKVASMGAQVLGEAVPGGGIAADIISGALDTEKDPESINKALENDPKAAFKLKQAELDHEEELKQIEADREAVRMRQHTKRIESVNESIQKQGAAWRKAIGWSFVFFVGLVAVRVAVLPVVLATTGYTNVLSQLNLNTELIRWICYCYLTVLGVASWHEGAMSRTMAGEQGGKLTKAIQAIKGK